MRKMISIDLFQVMDEFWTEGEGAQEALTPYLLGKSRDFSVCERNDVELKLFVTQNHAVELTRCEPKQMQNYLLRLQQLICHDAAQDEPQLTAAFREALLLQGDLLSRAIKKNGLTCIKVQGKGNVHEKGLLKRTLQHEKQIARLIFSWRILNATRELEGDMGSQARPDSDIEYLENAHVFITSTIESQRMVSQWINEFKERKQSQLISHMEQFCRVLNEMIQTLEMINVSSQDGLLFVKRRQSELEQFITEIDDVKSTGQLDSVGVTESIALMKQRVFREYDDIERFLKKILDCSDSPTSVADGMKEDAPPTNEDPSFSSLFFSGSAPHNDIGSASGVSPVHG